MKYLRYLLLFPFSALIIPFGVSAQVQNIFELGGLFLVLFNMLVVVLIALALVLFIWGVVQLITAQDDAEGRKEARKRITFGIIALFVMISVWGLVRVLVETFGTTETQVPIETTCEGPGCT